MVSGEEAEAKGEDEEKTNIQITKGTKKKLQAIRLTKRESYEEIIVRLLGEHKKG